MCRFPLYIISIKLLRVVRTDFHCVLDKCFCCETCNFGLEFSAGSGKFFAVFFVADVASVISMQECKSKMGTSFIEIKRYGFIVIEVSTGY